MFARCGLRHCTHHFGLLVATCHLGAPSVNPPIQRAGALVQMLRGGARGTDSDFVFQTLPTTWQTSAVLDPLAFDVVIHLGIDTWVLTT